MTTVTVLAFAAGFLLVFGVNLIYADALRLRRQKVLEQIQKEQRQLQKERAQASVSNRNLHELAAKGATDLAVGMTYGKRLSLFFEQSGVSLRPLHVVLLVVLFGAAAGGATWFGTRTYVYVALATAVAGALPCVYVVLARRRRMQRLLEQLPDAFDLISRMMRAGRTFPQALQAAADSGSSPLSDELAYCYDQQQLGMTPDAALRDLSRRSGLLEIKIFVLAVSIHRQTGGNLSDLLEKLADVIRDRLRVKGVISSLTAEGRLQVYVLTALPILSLAIMSIVSPKYAQQLYERPYLLAATATAMLIGWSWMRRIINFAY